MPIGKRATKAAQAHLNGRQRQIHGASQRHLDRSSRSGQEPAEKLRREEGGGGWRGGRWRAVCVLLENSKNRTVVIKRVTKGIGICRSSGSGSETAWRRAAAHNSPDDSCSQRSSSRVVGQQRAGGLERLHNLLVQPLHVRRGQATARVSARLKRRLALHALRGAALRPTAKEHCAE